MRHKPINKKLFVQNRQRLAGLMAPKSLAVLNANDVLPTNADGSLPMQPNADLFYLSGIEQEESVLLLYPVAAEEQASRDSVSCANRIRTSANMGRLQTQQGERTENLRHVKNVQWLSEFPVIFRSLMLRGGESAYSQLQRAQTRDSRRWRRATTRFIRDCRHGFSTAQLSTVSRCCYMNCAW